MERAYPVVTTTPIMAGPVVFQMDGGEDGKSIVRASPAGRLKVEVQGLPQAAR